MTWIPCPKCEEQIVVHGPGVYTCRECGRKVRHEPEENNEEDDRREARHSHGNADPWYVNWTRWLCYTHLIMMLIVIPIALFVELIVGVITVGIGLPVFFTHLVLVPMCFLPGLVPLLFVDLWKAHARGKIGA